MNDNQEMLGEFRLKRENPLIRLEEARTEVSGVRRSNGGKRDDKIQDEEDFPRLGK